MTAFSSVYLQLGSVASAAGTDNSNYSQILAATSLEELAAVKSGLAATSIDKLDILILDGLALESLYNPMELANWVPFLKKDAMVSIKIITPTALDLQPVHTSFLLAGLSSVSECKEADGSRVLVATRKAAPLMTAKPLKKSTQPLKKSTPGPVITLDLRDYGQEDDDADLIDEDGLLDDSLLAPPPAMNTQTTASTDDCAGRTPCDNCTCGRADAAKEGEPKIAPSSSCGKCHMGDAFRCASCPYLGKPAFKAGEEHLVLQLTDDL
jgi:anamorsin